MTSQFDLTQFYDVIICNSVFQLGFLTREFYRQFNVEQQQKTPSLAASVVHISTLNEGRGGGIAEALHSFYPRLWVQKTKASIYEISRMWILILLIFAKFKFVYFEIEVSFGLIWVNLPNGRFHLQIFILGYLKVLVSSIGFIFAHFVYKENFW